MVVIWNTTSKKCILWAREINQINVFLNCYISFQDMHILKDFSSSVINHDHINELHLFCDSFE